MKRNLLKVHCSTCAMCRDFNLPEVSRLLSTICDFKRPAFFLTLRKALPPLSLFRILELEVNFSPSASCWGSLPEDNVDVSIPIDGFRITTSSLWSIKEELEEKEFEDGDACKVYMKDPHAPIDSDEARERRKQMKLWYDRAFGILRNIMKIKVVYRSPL